MRHGAGLARVEALPVEAGEIGALPCRERRGDAFVAPVLQLDLVDVEDVLGPRRGLADGERLDLGLDVPGVVVPARRPTASRSGSRASGAASRSRSGGGCRRRGSRARPARRRTCARGGRPGGSRSRRAGPRAPRRPARRAPTRRARRRSPRMRRASAAGSGAFPAATRTRLRPTVRAPAAAAEPLPGRVHLALGAVLPFDLVPVGDSHVGRLRLRDVHGEGAAAGQALHLQGQLPLTADLEPHVRPAPGDERPTVVELQLEPCLRRSVQLRDEAPVEGRLDADRPGRAVAERPVHVAHGRPRPRRGDVLLQRLQVLRVRVEASG